MKTKEYVDKYDLANTTKFDHSLFVDDLNLDFIDTLAKSKGYEVYKGFTAAIRTIKEKFDSISKKAKEPLPDKLWKYIFATRVAPARKQFHEKAFAKDIEAKQKEKEWKKQQRWEEEDLVKDIFERFSAYGAFMSSNPFLKTFIRDLFNGPQGISTDVRHALSVLGLDESATKEEVLTNFRRLAHEHHPDKNGNPIIFMEILAAKNKCMELFESKMSA